MNSGIKETIKKTCFTWKPWINASTKKKFMSFAVKTRVNTEIFFKLEFEYHNCNCIWGTEIAFKIKKQKWLKIVHAQKYFHVRAKFSSAKNLILQKIVSGIYNVVNFKDFSRPNREIKYFSRTLTKFKDFSRRLLKFKTFSRLYELWVKR